MELSRLPQPDTSACLVTTWTPAVSNSAWSGPGPSIDRSLERRLDAGERPVWRGSHLTVHRRFDAGVLRRSLIALIARHEALRTAVVPTLGGWERRTCTPAEVCITDTRTPWHHPAEAHRLIVASFGGVRADRWPHYAFATASDPVSTSFLVAFAADEVVVEDDVHLLWLDELVTLYDAVAAGATLAELAQTRVLVSV